MKTLEKFKELLEGYCLEINDSDVNTFRELNMGAYLFEDMDGLCFYTDFELEPEDFKQDIAFLINFAETLEERQAFIDYMYNTFQGYWKHLKMSKEDLTRSIIIRYNEREL